MTQAVPKQRITVDLPWELYEQLRALPGSANSNAVKAIEAYLDEIKRMEEH